jgi:hypothetical protein
MGETGSSTKMYKNHRKIRSQILWDFMEILFLISGFISHKMALTSGIRDCFAIKVLEGDLSPALVLGKLQ